MAGDFDTLLATAGLPIESDLSDLSVIQRLLTNLQQVPFDVIVTNEQAASVSVVTLGGQEGAGYSLANASEWLAANAAQPQQMEGHLILPLAVCCTDVFLFNELDSTPAMHKQIAEMIQLAQDDPQLDLTLEETKRFLQSSL